MELSDLRLSRPATQEACACRWVQASWDELAQMCLYLAEQMDGKSRPDVVVALARAGYVPGAILASVLRCELLTLRVPPNGDRGRPAPTAADIAWLHRWLAGHRVLVFDETSLTGESLAWAAGATTQAGAVSVRTAVLIRTPGSPPPDFWAATSAGHFLQPWVRYCLASP